MWIGVKRPRPRAGSSIRPERIASSGSRTHGRQPGPYTSAGRMIVQAWRPAACAASTRCSAVILVSV